VIGCSRTASTINDPRYTHYCVDVSEYGDVIEMYAEVSARFGRLDAVINNAAVSTPRGLLSSALLTTTEECLRVFKINCIGAFLHCRESVKLMRERSFGRIINISSISAREVFAGASMYSASKAALEQYTRVLASEVFDFGITANIVSLSVVEESGMANSLRTSVLTDVANRTIIDRPTLHTEIHSLIEYLLSENSSAITGQIITVGG
jgi:3-oxoacyl-[acyl-carrier protein] reductase